MLRPSLTSRQPPAANFSFLRDFRAPASVLGACPDRRSRSCRDPVGVL